VNTEKFQEIFACLSPLEIAGLITSCLLQDKL